ncbi:alpha/beta hydrolase [Kribbella sandramycini]|uniref:Alpha/beta hydrolase n=1 Tax=Kribbella sandramycini TaxID=60450 RepID=A0A7Y4KWK0_9ACTN|nr:pimeloyl-ACP methyl ester carboxylesterase [Kribbella sandramycini]NOL39998.1 alpha/beta hydrolase [Kribbella sandramycini]
MKRLVRVLRRIFVVLVVIWLVLTGASLTYNFATRERAEPPPGLKFVRTADLQTRYDSWGTTGTPIVLVHGSAEAVETWSRLVPLLAAKHRVYAYDITGYGYSERKAPYTIEHLTAQLLGFLDAMKLGGPGQPKPILVGHSLGAGVIAAAALEQPAKIAGLMFLDGDALPLPGGGPPEQLVRTLIVEPYRTTALRLVLGSDSLIRRIYDDACARKCAQLTHDEVRQWTRPYRIPGAEQALWQMFNGTGIPAVSPDRLATLKTLPLETSVVFGALDNQGGSAEQTATRIGAPAPTIIPDAGHLTLISHPAEVAAAIDALVTRVQQAAARG